jgi:hypothetical protein
MDKKVTLMGILFLSLIATGCGAIPTLPPLESTISIRTPQITYLPGTAQTDPSQTAVTDESPTAAVTSVPFTATLEVESTSTFQQPTATFTSQATSPGKPEPTRTPTVKPPATKTATREPSATPAPTFTSTPLPYQVQVRNPLYLENFVHPDQSCDWMGAAGQIFNSEGSVVKDIVIRAGGTLNGVEIMETMTMPLANPEDDKSYGPGGFELQFAESPFASEDQIWIQLFDLGGAPLSKKIFLETFDDCQKNLILLNFIEE